ncbi:alkaline phosphatase D family protein [Catenovulum maritimum]|uniref:Twin-arginine translocation pathway signal n=1 Tax=Catenovulum maritimum TaxID=1513271 RepID=A0A0J8GZS8_9ALTE|nr:alkaline phosphatase D family protein [Catenovulum maritimum]KMT66739.1 twin-arginine translocation pathway signal [Catenovulum maritimum]
MTREISRRSALKFAAAGMVATSIGCKNTPDTLTSPSSEKLSTPMRDKWGNTHDRTWLGGEYWANPMEDWCIVNGWAECKSTDGNRSIHSLTHRLIDAKKAFNVSVNVEKTVENKNDGGAGIRLGINNEINEYRSSCFVQRGLDVGIIDNHLVIANKKTPFNLVVNKQAVRLDLSAQPQYGAVLLTVKASLCETGQLIGQLTHLVPANEVVGNLAVVSNFKLKSKAGQQGGRYRFSHWLLSGDAFEVSPERKFGPILWTMYSLSDSRGPDGFVMKLSAYTGPMGKHDNQHIELQVKRSGRWVSLGTQPLDTDAWVANFRVTNWNEKSEQAFRVIYNEKRRDGSEVPDIYSGLIKANPVGRPLRMAALTCQNDYSFPYAPVAENVKKLNPDLVFFSGDQIYESHGGFGIIREPFEPAIHNYLRKFYQFGWAFRDVMRDQPTICLPDDHDVFQGNLWGEGGLPKKHPELDPTASFLGGYIEPVRFVNAVHRTCVSHHPDPYDPTSNPSGISCYYSDMVYGDVGFAILADRQWKSGPEQAGVVVGETGVGEDPNFINPEINPKNPVLLGQRQEAFLAQWGNDWRGHKLKAVLSQTVFAGISTHQPSPERYLKYDFDSSGWPGPARDQAVSIMRKSKALHICGDTHLASLAQYGVEKQRDSNWSFCTPAISAGWPRWWLPDQVAMPHKNRPQHGLAQTGEFIDAFGNKVYVYAVGVPEVGQSKNRYVKAHEKGSGFGFITFDTDKLTYTLDAYRYLIDINIDSPVNQFDGWPVTIHQEENIGVNRLG